MAFKRVQRLRHTTSSAALFPGLVGEITVNTDDWSLLVHTGGGAGTHKVIPIKTVNDAAYQPFSALITSFASLGPSTGIIAKTAAGTVTARTITGVTDETEVSNGDGVSGNPTIGLATTFKSRFNAAETASSTKLTFTSITGTLGVGQGHALGTIVFIMPTMGADEFLIVARDNPDDAVTIDRNGQTFEGLAEDFVLDVDKQIYLLRCDVVGDIKIRLIGAIADA